MVSKVRNIFSSLERLKNVTILRPESGLKLNTPPLCNLAKEVTSKKIVYIGETHSQASIVDLELAVLSVLTDHVRLAAGSLHVFLEHFCLEQQPLLDSYVEGEISDCDLLTLYEETGDEGHDLEPYKPFFQFVKEHKDTVRLYAGFVPRRFAKMLVKEGEDVAYDRVIELGYMAKQDIHRGTSQHYDFFESLISGRDLSSGEEPGDRFEKIFPAQILKDCVMASVVKRGIEASTNVEDKFLVIAGAGHIDYRFGVPERVDWGCEVSPEETTIITCRSEDLNHGRVEGEPYGQVNKFSNQFPGQFVYFYEDEEDVKEEIAEAYNAVSKTAHIKGDLEKAARVMARLGYTKQQILQARDDAANYQGVSCPHGHACIQPGETVLDIGSGLGADSFIAAAATGPNGRVVGLDISKGEVEHANKRALQRQENNVSFVHGDMEKMTFDDNTFDKVISNGAFCLAPSKEAAFKEVMRVLKPGGKFSVCCTTLREQLEEGVSWPICMRVFMPLKEAVPMLQKIGFQEVDVDLSDTLMTFELEGEGEEVAEEEDSGRKKIHVGSEEFKHLENYDMNKLCARVILHGRKPTG